MATHPPSPFAPANWHQRLRTHWPVAATALLGVVLSVAAHLWEQTRFQDHIQMQFQLATEERRLTLQAGIRRGLEELEDLQLFFTHQPQVDNAAFRLWGEAFFPPDTPLRAIAWAPRVAKGERIRFEEAAGREWPGFRIHQAGDPPPGMNGETTELFVVLRLLTTPPPALQPGLELFRNPAQGEAIRKAALTGLPAATPADAGTHPDYLVFFPVYRSTAPPTDPRLRWEHLTGMVVGVFQPRQLLESALPQLQSWDVDFLVHDITTPHRERLLHHHTSRVTARETPTPAPGIRNPAEFEQFQVPLQLADRQWRLAVRFLPELPLRHGSPPQRHRLLLSGLLFTTLLTFYLWLNTTRRQLAMRDQALNSSAAAFAMSDPEGRLTHVNPAFRQLWDLPAHRPVTGVRWHELWHDPQAGALTLQEVAKGGSWSGHLVGRREGGGRFEAEVLGDTVRDARGRPMGLVWSLLDVSQRVEMETALRESREMFRQLAENIQEVFWVLDLNLNRILYVSPAYETIWGGYCRDLYRDPDSWSVPIHPDDRERARTTFSGIGRSGLHSTYRIIRPDGAVRWIQDRAFPIVGEDGAVERMVGVANDITELVQHQEELRIHASIVDASGEVMALLDRQGIFRAVNEAALHAHALPRTGMVGQPIASVWEPDDLRRLQPALTRALEGQPATFQGELSLAGWGRCHLDASFHPHFGTSSQVEGVVMVARDVTERRRLEEEQDRLRAQAIHASRLASLGELSASVAHEINNPNNVINFDAEILARVWGDAAPLLERALPADPQVRLGGLPVAKALEKSPQLIEEIRRASQRIANIVANLKEMARQDDGAVRQPVAVGAILEAAVQMLRNRITRHTDHFRLAIQPGLPSLPGHPQQLEQVFINVILNGLEALPDRRGTVVVEAGPAPDGEAIQVTVTDQGVGIPAELRDRVTDPFFSTKLERGGTGLGLSISRTILQAHGGTLAFASPPGGGTRVTVRLPLQPPSPLQESP